MWFPYLKTHTIIDIVDGTTTTMANIYAAVAAHLALVLKADTASAYGSGKYQDFYKGVAAASATAVHAAITLADGATTVVTTAITAPVHYRTVSITGNASGITGNVVVVGTDRAGNAQTDTIAANDTDTVVGVKPFSTITSITVPARTQASDTISIGIADVLGLSRPVSASANVLYVGIAADAVNASTFTYEAAGSVDTTNNTVTLTTSITASDDITIDFYSSAL